MDADEQRSGLERLALPISIAAFIMAGAGTLFRPGFALNTHPTVYTPPPMVQSTPAEPQKLASANPVAGNAVAPVETGRSAQEPQLSLPRAEVDKLFARGQVLIGAGDFAAARLVLSRASEAGHPGATFALASTYDPNILAKVKVKGLVGEPEQARMLYARALAAGMRDAGARIAALGG